MRKSTIRLEVELDAQSMPERIAWDASEKPEGGLSDTKAIALSVWDHEQKNTLRIDLWTKEMPVDEMKRFCIDCVGGLAQTILTATSDEWMATEMRALCDRLAARIRQED
jgi:gliding motility-associated protein GldC